jgi:beta-xylosidase
VPSTSSRRPSALPRRLAAGLTLLLALCLPVALLSATAPSAEASAGSDRFWAGLEYHGEFGAPSVLRVGSTYYAYATNTDGNNLPLLTSTDLETWTARAAWPVELGFSSWRGYNDAMPFPATWAAKLPPNGKPGVWSPAVIELGGQYVDAYAVQMTAKSNRHCLTLATSPLPDGPFLDTSTKPLYCSSDPMGSIDPAWLKVGGKVFLVWKNAGVPGSKPTEVLAQRMTADGLRFAPGTKPHVLLRTAQKWEGNVIEAPSMVKYGGRYYLFYSGNRYTTADYAIGYAVCSGPLGPCTRPRSKPLLASGGSIAGPGAQSPVVDTAGRLRLAYSAWTTGQVGYPKSSTCRDTADGCNQRRMYVATLSTGPGGALVVDEKR